MELKKMTITPDMAREIIMQNIANNRLLNWKYVDYFAEMMRKDLWFPDTGEAIKFDGDMNLIDGQHRLHAIIKANKPITMAVIYNVPSEAFKYIDTGRPRGGSDVFKIERINNYTYAPAIIRMYLNLKNYKYHQRRVAISNSELLDEYYKKPDYWQELCNESQSLYKAFSKIIKLSEIGGLIAYFSLFSKEDAHDFMAQLCTGKNINNESIINLRNRLISNYTSHRKVGVTVKVAMIIKTWNYYRRGAILKVIKYDSELEQFPKAI